MNILALDLSTKSTGYCVGDSDNKLIDYGCLTSKKKDDVVKKILFMKSEIEKILFDNDIQQVILEEVRVDYQNAHTYKVLTWLQFAIVETVYLYNPNIEIQYLQPSSWRSKIGIKTGAGIRRDQLKQADIDWVKNKYGITVNDDIADAICIYNSIFYKEPIKKTGGFAW